MVKYTIIRGRNYAKENTENSSSCSNDRRKEEYNPASTYRIQY